MTHSLPSRDGRAGGRERRSERPLSVGLPPHPRRPVRREHLRHHGGAGAPAGTRIYGEAAGVSLEIPEDTLLNKSQVEIPMGEFWVHALHPELMYYQDVRGAASASHVYGKKMVATESFTAAVMRPRTRSRRLAITGLRRASTASSSTPRRISRWTPSRATPWWGLTSTATSPGRNWPRRS